MLGLAAAFFSAVNFVLFGYVEATVSYTSAFAYSRILFFLMTIPFFFWVKPDLAYSLKKGGKKFLFAAGFAEGINAIGIFFMVWAFSIGSVSLVNALIATEPFMVLAITVFLTLFFPSLIKEEIGKGTIIYKLIAILMIFAGVWMVN
jgi:hypothetical protein